MIFSKIIFIVIREFNIFNLFIKIFFVYFIPLSFEKLISISLSSLLKDNIDVKITIILKTKFYILPN